MTSGATRRLSAPTRQQSLLILGARYPIEPSLLCTCCCRMHADQPLLVITQLPSEARARTLRSHHRALSGPRSLICARAPSPRQARSASAAAANTAPRSGGTRPPRVQSKAAADIKPLAAVPSSAGEALERQRVKQPVVMLVSQSCRSVTFIDLCVSSVTVCNGILYAIGFTSHPSN